MQYMNVAHIGAAACALMLSAALGLSSAATAETLETALKKAADAPHFDTEHIFGFGEGSDIGEEGVLEMEVFTVGIFGALGRNFSIGNGTSLRYSVTDELRFSAGVLSDYLNIHNLPGVNARNGLNVNGIFTEVRWNIFNRHAWPFGVTLTVDPEWRRTDPATGEYNDNFAVTAALLIDKEVIPETFFMELNLIYSPAWLPVSGRFLRDDAFTVILGGSYVITPEILVGAEIRHENLRPNGFSIAHALFVGPHVFLQVHETTTASFAWAFQLPDLGARHSNLVNFERYEAGLRIIFQF
ncbi:MAG: hypothetical protein L0Y57_03155 [Beijerinckiaceae bacterium]|nr:hypothetical protein [Beijerinckiaceae bacterium]